MEMDGLPLQRVDGFLEGEVVAVEIPVRPVEMQDLP